MQERLGFSRARHARIGTTNRGRSGRRLWAAIGLAALATAGLPSTEAAALPSLDAAAPAASAPQPALWVVSDADTTIYLFGTFHALDHRRGWFSSNVKAAFDASDELVLETLVPEDPAELHAVLARHSLAMPAVAGQPVVATRAAHTFVGSASQAMSAGRSMGMSVDHGADAVLRRAAVVAGKPVGGLESFDFQLGMFGRLPAPATTLRPRRQAAANLPQFLSHMQSAWQRGDNSSFAAILGDVRAQSPATYKILFADRNASWAGWIAGRLQMPGTVFLAVGTGHLIGSDSVQQNLAARGIYSARVS